MAVMREALHVPGQEVYGKALYFPLNFVVNQKLLENEQSIVTQKSKLTPKPDRIWVQVLDRLPLDALRQVTYLGASVSSPVKRGCDSGCFPGLQ